MDEAVDRVESGIAAYENEIFNGAFSASQIEKVLNAIKALEMIYDRRGSGSPDTSLSEKKQYYLDTYDDMSKVITPAKKNWK